jgi:hypothetical protein
MGKRSDFERIARDFYRTPTEAVLPLRPFFGGGETFCEPCAGDGALVRALISIGLECVSAYDIQRRRIGFGFRTPCSWRSNTLLAVIALLQTRRGTELFCTH